MNKTHDATEFASDRDVARRVAAGDAQAFDQFFNEHYDRVYRFALGRLHGNHHTAEDIVQQTFTRALDGMENYRGEAQLFTWLCTICRNIVTDWYRKQGRTKDSVVLIEDRPDLRAMIESFSAPAHEAPEGEAQRADAIRLIQVVLDQLPPNYGDILEWRYIEGFSASEVAVRLNLSIEATNSMTARAKRAFAQLYAPLLSTVQHP